MTEEKQENDQGADVDYGWDDIDKMSIEAIKEELLEQRKRYETLESNLFKAQTASRRFQSQIKQL